jgi:hypothetical protein
MTHFFVTAFFVAIAFPLTSVHHTIHICNPLPRKTYTVRNVTTHISRERNLYIKKTVMTVSDRRHRPVVALSYFLCFLSFYFCFTEHHAWTVSCSVSPSGGSEFESRLWYLPDWEILKILSCFEAKWRGRPQLLPLPTTCCRVQRTAEPYDCATEHHFSGLKPIIPFPSAVSSLLSGLSCGPSCMLDLSKGHNRLRGFLNSPEDGTWSSFRNVAFSSYSDFRMMEKVHKLSDSQKY